MLELHTDKQFNLCLIFDSKQEYLQMKHLKPCHRYL